MAASSPLLPPFTDVPSDDDDWRFTKSFAVNDAQAARDFFQHYGFVVFRDVVSKAQCQACRDHMWRATEELSGGRFDRTRPETWDAFPGNFGMPSKRPIFAPEVVSLRQEPGLVQAFCNILQAEPSELLASHDRWLLYRPTREVPLPSGPCDKPGWKTVKVCGAPIVLPSLSMSMRSFIPRSHSVVLLPVWTRAGLLVVRSRICIWTCTHGCGATMTRPSPKR